MSWYLAVLSKYAVFSGRARRKEYWMFALLNVLIIFGIEIVLGIIALIVGEPSIVFLIYIYSLVVFVPATAVGVRRLHDTDHSGWWLLFPFVNLVLLCSEGTLGDNSFGSDPKA